MARVSQTRLANWASALIDDEECMQEVRDRFQLKMLDRFRAANKDVRDEINYIMDNEQAFFEELQSICDDIRNVNQLEEDAQEIN